MVIEEWLAPLAKARFVRMGDLSCGDYMIDKATSLAEFDEQSGRPLMPTWRDSHGGRPDEYLSRACIACRHCAIDWNTYNPLTRQDAQGADAPFKGLRVRSAHKG